MIAVALALSIISADPLAPGDYTRVVEVDGRNRTYFVHIPPQHDPKRPTPVVLAFHGAMTNGRGSSRYRCLSKRRKL